MLVFLIRNFGRQLQKSFNTIKPIVLLITLIIVIQYNAMKINSCDNTAYYKVLIDMKMQL